ncbi:type II secretion system F family protein [Bordetella sp. 2513F-2]
MDAMLELPPVRLLLIACLCGVMAAMLALAAAIVARAMRQGRSLEVVERALAARDGRHADVLAEAPAGGRVAAVARGAEQAGERLDSGRLGGVLLAGEDRRLVDMAGFDHASRARAWFALARLGLAIGLPLLVWLVLHGCAIGVAAWSWPAALFAGFALGWMLPKWVLQRRVARRKARAGEELPLLLDLLRLLQGVGLSIDQSLHVLVTDFRSVMPVLGQELRLSIDLYARGRTREQSLARLAQGYGNDDLAAVCRLIVQVDRHGGAVQEPLARFAERLRERRRLELKARVARLTVKMTGVMVLTLLPALLIVTGGSGFIALLRGLSRVGGGS